MSKYIASHTCNAEESILQDFRLRKIDETKNYFIEEMKKDDLMFKKHKKVYIVLRYIEKSLKVNNWEKKKKAW